MHEHGIAGDVVRVALEHAGGRRLAGITVNVGGLSGVNTGSLELFMEIILKEKGMPGVRVALHDVPARFRCACGTEFDAERIYDPCPACGGNERTACGGQECTVETIEVADE